MPGLLADANLDGHLVYLRERITSLNLLALVTELHLELVTFSDLGLERDLSDRDLWQYCQINGWVLFTDNRNQEGQDSLQATLNDSWKDGHLPILTLGNKSRFENSSTYAGAVAEDVVELLFDIFHEQKRDQPRIFVPRW